MSRTYWLPLIVVVLSSGCTGSTPKPAGSSPEKKKDEASLAFTDLSKKAYEKLEIKIEKMALQEVRERRALTGWVMAKPGHEVTLTAPTAGYVQFLKGRNLIAGDEVAAKDELLQLEPVLSPVEKIQVAALKRSTEAEYVKAQTTLKNANVEYKRAVELKDIKSKQEFEQAKKALDFADEEFKAAKDKLTYFQTQTITLKAPQAGVIAQLHVGPGQYVSASAPLVTIIDLHPVWVRVAVPEFDFDLIDSAGTVEVTFKNANHGRPEKSSPPSFKARLVARVPQVDPIKHTGDIWYELEDAKGNRFMKDQMVTVQLPVGKKEKAPVVPVSSVIYDAHGHAWIYLEITKDGDAKHRFERRPVEVVAAVDSGLMLRTKMADGERVVTNGAAVLFSRDFHKTPIQIDGEDN